jgi:hypothetical protein
MLLKLDAFDCTILHRPGHKNLGADFLSRLTELTTPACPVATPVPIIASIQPVVVESPSRRKAIMQDYHENGLLHLGTGKTVDAITRRFSWPGLRQNVKDFIKHCPTCQQFTTPIVAPVKPVQPIPTTHCQELLSIDIIGPLPRSSSFQYIIIAVDHYSKFAWARPIRRANSQACVSFVQSIFSRHGPWTAISTDGAQAFCSHAFSSLLTSHGVDHRVCTPSHSEGNGAVERLIRTVRQFIRKNSSPAGWSKDIGLFMSTYNATTHSATQAAPIEVFLCKPAVLSSDQRFNVPSPGIRSVQGTDAYRRSFTRPPVAWDVGTRLWHIPRIRSDKKLSALRHFQPTRRGPFTYVGPSHRPQFASVTDGAKNLSLPLWELQISR